MTRSLGNISHINLWVHIKGTVFGLSAMTAFFFLGVTNAFAADIVHKVAKNGEDVIIIWGEIKLGDDEKFNKVAAPVTSATVILNSEGGSVYPSLEIGKSLRLKGFSTLVMNGYDCQSACALIWLAGSPRRLSRSAKVGFHSIYQMAGDKTVTSSVGNAIVGRYLTLLNLPEKAVIFATVSAPENFNWLGTGNYREVGIDLAIDDDYGDKSDGNSRGSQIQGRSSNSSNSETYKYGNVESWGIYVDKTLGNACFVIAEYERGTVLRVGFQNNRNTNGMILFGHNSWSSLVSGQEYELTAKFGSYAEWSLPTTAIDMGGTIFLKGVFSDQNFWTEFAKAGSLSLSYKGKSVALLRLTNSSRALDMMIDCQKAQRSVPPDDPFAN